MLHLYKSNMAGICSVLKQQIWYDVCLVSFDNVCLLLETTILAYRIMVVIAK